MISNHTRLALVLLVALVLAGALNLHSTLVTTDLYLQEVNQSIHLDLAANIARMKYARLLTADGQLRDEGLEEVLHWMMVVNPGPHFYLLDLEGRVLAYDPAAGEVLAERVSLSPIAEFLAQQTASGRPARAIVGDDPREPGRPKVFSAAPIPPQGAPTGYLYVVLASRHVDSAAERLRNSYILRLSTRNAVAYLAVVLLAGWLVFRRLTRPLRRLAGRIRDFHRRDCDPDAGAPEGDEVRLLERTFGEMSQRIERQMAEIERMARARRELIANVSHDLRTPIALLRGYLDTLALKDESVSRREREEYLEIAVRQSERLGKLVDELLELTRLDAREVEPRMERFQLAELVQDNVQRFQLQASREGVLLTADFEPDLPPIVADVGLMERVLENLIDNALRFTPPDGSVTVTLREHAGRLRLRVADTGCGIAEDDLPHIFDRYYRSRSGAEAARHGAGLGLAIVQRILELHGSELEIRSRPGRGTTVCFDLEAAPRARPLATSPG